MILKRKPKDESRRYKVETLGGLIIEKVQVPHSLVKEDGSEYHMVTWTISLRVESGPLLFERSYAMGDKEDLDAMRGYFRPHIEVEFESMAHYLFYQDLYKVWNFNEDLG